MNFENKIISFILNLFIIYAGTIYILLYIFIIIIIFIYYTTYAQSTFAIFVFYKIYNVLLYMNVDDASLIIILKKKKNLMSVFKLNGDE